MTKHLKQDTHISISSISNKSKAGFIINDSNHSSLKHTFGPSVLNPVNLRQVQPLDFKRNIVKVEPFNIYRTTNRVSSIKRVKQYDDEVFESKVLFTPIKKEWKPVLARDRSNINIQNYSYSFNKLFNK